MNDSAALSNTGRDRNDDEELRLLLEQYERKIYNWAFAVVRNHEDAEDIAQEVWIKVAQRFEQLRDTNKLTPWLFRIARNCALDVLEKRKSRPEPVPSVPEEYRLTASESELSQPEDTLLSLDERGRVWEALGHLSERDREALSLREFHGLSYKEIGETLSISRGAAEVMVHRARQRFRRHFTEIENGVRACGMTRARLGASSGVEETLASDVNLNAHIDDCASCQQWVNRITLGRRAFEPTRPSTPVRSSPRDTLTLAS